VTGAQYTLLAYALGLALILGYGARLWWAAGRARRHARRGLAPRGPRQG
jgi:hypothetical protein